MPSPDDGDPRLLRIQLFGEMELRVGDEPLPALESARARSLLACVLLHAGPPQPRQRLAFQLWPDSTEGQARTNLRHLLHTLRRAAPTLDPFLEVMPQTIRWRREVACWVDVIAFENALATAEKDPAGQAALDALRAAIRLYSGDLLDGCDDDWLVDRRERLRDQYASALERAGELLVDRGEFGEAIRVGRELLRCDPLREDTYRALMRVHGAAGDRAGAVRVYHECVSTLQRELDVDPSAPTKSAYAALTRPGPASAPADAAPARVSGAALVGREGEWQQLADHWRTTEEGRAHLVLLTGEPGIGKTRLVEELATWCGHRGALVAHARSYPSEGELGYGVAVSWLRTPELAVQLRRANPADLVALASLLPELAHGATGAPADALDAAAQKRRLFESISRTLVAGRPTLLIADDAQWSDEQSLQLIHYLVRVDRSRRLLVVATVRREGLADGHPLDALASGLQVVDAASEIALGRLGPEDTVELARRLAGPDLDPGLADGLFAETEGNPLFIVEARRAGLDRGGALGGGLSPKLQAVIDVRLRQVSPPARRLLGLAATVGREFTAAVLGRASTIDETALVRGLDELWRRGLIREQGIDAYDFAHGKIRDVAYESLSSAERRRNHLVIADALLTLADQDVGAMSGEVARHFERAGQIATAVAWYQRAAVHAQQIHANNEAVHLLDRAGELVRSLPEGAARRRLELEVLSALPTPLAVVDGFASSRLAETQRRVLAIAEQVGIEPEPSLLRSLAMTMLCRDDFDGARAVAARLGGLANRNGDELLAIETEYLLGIAAFWQGTFEAAVRHFEEVARRFDPRRHGEHVLRFGHDPRVVCVSRLANTLWFLGRDDDARRARDEAVALACEVAHPFSRGAAHAFAAALALDLDEPTRFKAYAAALAVDAEYQALHVAGEVFGGYADVLDGRAEDGVRRIQAAIGTVNHAPGQRALHLRVLLAACDVGGDAAGGLRASEDALAAGGTRIWEPEYRLGRAGFLAALGSPWAEVDAELARAAELARRQGALGPLGRVERARAGLLGSALSD